MFGLKGRMQIVLRECIRVLYRLLFVLPVRRRTILFDSFNGTQYSDNTKYICEYLDAHYPGRYRMYWAFTAAALPGKDFKYETVKMYSFRWLVLMATSEFIISNVRPISIVPARRGQHFIETWHAGGAYKRVGNDIPAFDKSKQLLV